MLSEDEIVKLYNSKVRLFAETGDDKYLESMTTLEKVLEISASESDRIFYEALDKIETNKKKRQSNG